MPVCRFRQRDEEPWDEALHNIVEELEGCDGCETEDSMHKIRTVANLTIA
jgi:hypothetical protein